MPTRSARAGRTTAHAAVLLSVLLAFPALALDPDRLVTQYVHERWTTREGLPQMSVHAMLQTRDGYLWLGTEEGLARFDGASMTVFHRKTVAAFESNYVLALEETSDGSLWIGLGDGGIVRYRDGEFERRDADEDFQGGIRSIREDESGRLWMSSSRGGLLLVEGDRMTRYGTEDGISHKNVADVVPDGHGGLWVGTLGGGLCHWMNGRVDTLTVADGLSSPAITALHRDRRGDLWLGTHAGLVDVIRQGRIENVSLGPGTGTKAVRAIFEDRDGNLWIANDLELYRYHDGAIELFRREGGRSIEMVRSFCEDSEGNLWIGTFGDGLHRLRDGKVRVWGRLEGLSHDKVGPVMGSRDGDMWLGTMGGGLNRIRPDGRIDVWRTGQGLVADHVESLTESPSGDIWYGSLTRGIGKLTADMPGPPPENYWVTNGLPNAGVLGMSFSRSGDLWVASNGGGLVRFRDGEFRSWSADSGGFPSDHVREIKEAPDGTLWVATYGGGLVRFRDGSWEQFSEEQGLSANGVFTLHLDEDGTPWVGTIGKGVHRFRDGTFSAITSEHGLFNDTVYSIIEDDAGYFWMSCNLGIFRAHRTQLEAVADGTASRVDCEVFGESDGMRSRECNGASPSAWKDGYGRIWFPTLDGCVVIDPLGFPKNAVPPPVRIEKVLVDGSPVGPEPGLVVPPGRSRYEFHYAALSFTAPEKVECRYRLRGYEDAWVNAGQRRVAYYTNLPPGDYRFEVKAANDDGVWNEAGASLAFHHQPYFWQTTWFRALCVVATLAGGFLIYRWRVRGLRKKQRELEELVEAKTRAQRKAAETNTKLEDALAELKKAQDHMIEQERLRALGQMASGVAHDFNNTLAPILGFADLLISRPDLLQDSKKVSRYLTTIRTAAQDAGNVVNRLREFYRKGQDDESFPLIDLNRIVEQAVHLTEPKWKGQALAGGIGITVDTQLHDLPQVPGNESDLREMLTNMIFNAVDAMPDGGTITLRTRQVGTSVLIQVSDTGTGMSEDVRQRCLEPFFTTKGERGTGLGLPMVYGIIQRHHGEVEIDSERGAGTTFTVRLPVEGGTVRKDASQILETPPEKLRVLVVDDDTTVLEFLSDFLEGDGHRIETAADGMEGLERFRRGEFDLVVSDRAMPRMNGDQLASGVKRLRPEVGVLLLTGFGELMSARNEVPSGVDLVIGKPVTGGTLRRAIANVMRQVRDAHPEVLR